MRLPVCPSVSLSHLFDRSDFFQEWFSKVMSMQKVKIRGQRSEVNVTEVKTQFSRFRAVITIWIHIWWWNNAQSFMWHRRGALLFLAEASSSIDGFVCLSVCMRVSVTPSLTRSCLWIFIKLTPDIDLMKCLWHVPFQVKRSKVKLTGVIRSFVVSARGCVTIWPIWFLLGTNIIHDKTTCRDSFTGQKV